jgi:hypothetical protein
MSTTKAEGFEAPVSSWLVRVNRPFRIKWDLFVMILATWNWFQLPFSAAFMPELDTNIIVLLSNFIIDTLFVVDIWINFRTTYFSKKTGDEIM